MGGDGSGASASGESTRARAFTREETYAATRRPVALAETLIPEAYTSESVYRAG
jgi:hypothetical protein